MAGRKLDDHSFWAGGRSKGSVFPDGAKTQAHPSSEGAGAVMDYPDTTEHIHSDQRKADSMAKSQKMKPGYRY